MNHTDHATRSRRHVIRPIDDGEPTTAEIHAALARPDHGTRATSRRRFLQAAAAAGGATLLPLEWAEMAAAATPLGTRDGVVVIVWMSGGNDGLNTIAPVDSGRYQDLRRGAAVSPSAGLRIGNDPAGQARALHPELAYTQQLFRSGRMAIVDGVGDLPSNDLSHFESTARWMAGRAGHRTPDSGWVGRYVDGLPNPTDPFHSIHIGRSIPLHLQGRRATATGVPVQPGGLFNPATAQEYQRREMDVVDAFANGSTGLGALGDALAESGRTSLAVAGRLEPIYRAELPDEALVPDLTLAARLVNANLGIRVINVAYGDFDGHAGHPTMHAERMGELDRALRAFYETLDPAFEGRTLVLTLSEFGRRSHTNNSSGTDHGSASSLMMFGSGVVAGFHGAFPSLDDLDRQRNQKPVLDFRSVYSNVLERWLGADPAEVLEGTYGGLAALRSPSATNTAGAGSSPALVNERSQVFRLYLAYYLRDPDAAGLHYWVSARKSGRSLAAISQAFAESPEFGARYGALSDRDFVELVYRNVMDRAADAAGRDYWVGRLAAGITRGEMMIGFSESEEFREASAQRLYQYDRFGPVARLYQAYFRRNADLAGLAYWNNSDLPISAISRAFAESDEFESTYGPLSDSGFVRLVYVNVMDREPDEAGLRYWLSSLYEGMRRSDLMLRFSESPEFVERFRTL